MLSFTKDMFSVNKRTMKVAEDPPQYVATPPPAHIERAPVSHVLDAAHQSAFQRAVQNILSTPIAETTFAQIADGLPLLNVAVTGPFGEELHPSICDHKDLYPEALDKATSFLNEFECLKMELQVQVLQRYQSYPAGSKASKLPLVELVAVAIHRIAVLLFRTGNLLKERGLQDTIFCETSGNWREGAAVSHSTAFVLPAYADPSKYPEEGSVELPGYWAEDQIFGGVVLFSRGEGGTECNSVWLHPHRREPTNRICELTEEQLSDLLSFLAAETPKDGTPLSSPLPILVSRENRRRVDSELALPEYHIYRDRWERKILYTDIEDYTYMGGMSCVVDENDYPELEGTREYFTNLANAAHVGTVEVPDPRMRALSGPEPPL